MTAAIDTTIEGDLESIQAGVDWLRRAFGAAVEDSAADAARAGADSAHDWIGAAGDAFRAEADRLRGQADQLAVGVSTAAEGFDRYADALRAALRKREDIRAAASSAGLSLTATQILPPGAEPTVPDAKEAAADALAEYRRKTAAFEAAAEDMKRVKGDLWTAVQELVDVGSKVKDVAGKFDWSQVRENKLFRALRHGGKAFGVAGNALIGLDVALMALDGKRPGNIVARTAGEEVGGWAELISNNPRVAAFLRSVGVDPEDYDFEELGGDYAERLYRELPPGFRDGVDLSVKMPVIGPEALAHVLADEFDESGPPPGLGTPLPGEREAFHDMVEQGLHGVDDARDVVEGGADAYDDVKDLAEFGKDHLDDVADGFEPLVPSWS